MKYTLDSIVTLATVTNNFRPHFEYLLELKSVALL